MLTQQEQIVMENINATTKSLTISKIMVIFNDAVEISRGEPLSCAFIPGQIDAVKAFTRWDDTTPEVIYLNSVWTQDVIDAYQLLLNTGLP